MRYFSALFFFLLSGVPVGATCFVCDEVVELTKETAACFEQNFEILIEALESAPAGRQSVNVGACTGQDGAARREGLIEMGELPLGDTKRVKTVYILDKSSALCLRELLADFEGDFDPSHLFDLAELCNGE